MIINGKNIVNIPWEDRPQNCTSPVWRYSKNPIISRNPQSNLARVFNSALVPYENGFIGVFRGEPLTGVPLLYVGRSQDGLHIELEEHAISFINEDGTKAINNYGYDPRLIEIDGTYYIVWCDDFHGPALAIAKTTDFETFVKLDHPFLPFNRNGVLFPRKIKGEYVMLSRPSDSGHTAFGDIFMSKSLDMQYWGKHARVMDRGYEWWNGTKIGAGCNPIETKEGWLLFFHGVSGTCNGFVYSMGAALLDLDNPAKVLYRCEDYLLTPEEDYETRGFVPNVVFPTSALVDQASGKIAIYYGAADTYTCLAFTTIDLVIAYIKKHRR